MDDLEIDRTLRAALSEDPSPDFVARVRTTLAEAPRPSLFAGVWKPVAAVACVAVVAVAIGMRQDARLKPSPTRLAPVTADLKASTTTESRAIAPFRAAKAKARPSAKAPIATASDEPPMPKVLVAQKDLEALREFIASANEVRFTASFDETPAPTPWLITELPTTETHNN
jgi:hypothetical protein